MIAPAEAGKQRVAAEKIVSSFKTTSESHDHVVTTIGEIRAGNGHTTTSVTSTTRCLPQWEQPQPKLLLAIQAANEDMQNKLFAEAARRRLGRQRRQQAEGDIAGADDASSLRQGEARGALSSSRQVHEEGTAAGGQRLLTMGETLDLVNEKRLAIKAENTTLAEKQALFASLRKLVLARIASDPREEKEQREADEEKLRRLQQKHKAEIETDRRRVADEFNLTIRNFHGSSSSASGALSSAGGIAFGPGPLSAADWTNFKKRSWEATKSLLVAQQLAIEKKEKKFAEREEEFRREAGIQSGAPGPSSSASASSSASSASRTGTGESLRLNTGFSGQFGGASAASTVGTGSFPRLNIAGGAGGGGGGENGDGLKRRRLE